jgi:hypothetical protein
MTTQTSSNQLGKFPTKNKSLLQLLVKIFMQTTAKETHEMIIKRMENDLKLKHLKGTVQKDQKMQETKTKCANKKSKQNCSKYIY